MRSVSSFTDIYLCKRFTDFRKGINGLATLVSDLELNPLDGALFVFCCRSRDKIKILYWDKSGFALWHKRLEKEKFRWPERLADDIIILDSQELEALLSGIDISMKPHETLHYRAIA